MYFQRMYNYYSIASGILMGWEEEWKKDERLFKFKNSDYTNDNNLDEERKTRMSKETKGLSKHQFFSFILPITRFVFRVPGIELVLDKYLLNKQAYVLA